MANLPSISTRKTDPMLEFFIHHSHLTVDPEMVIVNKHYSALGSVLNQDMANRIILILLDDRRSRDIIIKIREHGITDPISIVKQFKACNWDTLEVRPDIQDDEQPNFEYVDCGYKGANKRCPFSTPMDPKPFCIIKSLFNIPNYAFSHNNQRHS